MEAYIGYPIIVSRQCHYQSTTSNFKHSYLFVARASCKILFKCLLGNLGLFLLACIEGDIIISFGLIFFSFFLLLVFFSHHTYFSSKHCFPLFKILFKLGYLLFGRQAQAFVDAAGSVFSLVLLLEARLVVNGYHCAAVTDEGAVVHVGGGERHASVSVVCLRRSSGTAVSALQRLAGGLGCKLNAINNVLVVIDDSHYVVLVVDADRLGKVLRQSF